MATDSPPKKKPPADDSAPKKKPSSDSSSKPKSGPKSPPADGGGAPPPAAAGPGAGPDPRNALPFPPVSGPPMGGPDPMAMGGMGGGPPDLAALLGLGGMGAGPPMGGLGAGPPMGGMGLGGPPPGPQLPIGGSMPPGGDMAGSPLLAMLASSLSSADPYAVTGAPVDLNVGPADPQMGLQGLLQLLCNAKLGTGGANASAGMSGVPMDLGQVGGGLYS
jgi:hypothetical protein